MFAHRHVLGYVEFESERRLYGGADIVAVPIIGCGCDECTFVGLVVLYVDTCYFHCFALYDVERTVDLYCVLEAEVEVYIRDVVVIVVARYQCQCRHQHYEEIDKLFHFGYK